LKEKARDQRGKSGRKPGEHERLGQKKRGGTQRPIKDLGKVESEDKSRRRKKGLKFQSPRRKFPKRRGILKKKKEGGGPRCEAPARD